METQNKKQVEIGRVLIVEDQGDPLRLLESVVKEIVPKYFPNFQAEETPILFRNYGFRQAQIQCLASRDYDIARSYNSARDMFSENKYGLILLDHRMPIEDSDEPIYPFERIKMIKKANELTKQINGRCGKSSIWYRPLSDETEPLREYDLRLREYSDKLQNIGYSLIPEIRRVNPSAIIIGTSSMKRELGDFPSPDFSLSKLNAKQDLERILQEIKIRNLKGGEIK